MPQRSAAIPRVSGTLGVAGVAVSASGGGSSSSVRGSTAALDVKEAARIRKLLTVAQQQKNLVQATLVVSAAGEIYPSVPRGLDALPDGLTTSHINKQLVLLPPNLTMHFLFKKQPTW